MRSPRLSECPERQDKDELDLVYDEMKKHKKVRRSYKKKNREQNITIMYSNIQGFTKKCNSLLYIMDELDCDICLLAETMTRKVKIDGCRCIIPQKSIGQNVCIIIRKNLANNTITKLYEPNETANMIGIRIELMDSSIRIFTAHLKQQSTNSHDEIEEQYEEVRKQFRYANESSERIIMAFDANVHVGSQNIGGCEDTQDWGGTLLMRIIQEENLVLLNSSDKCKGVITRIDPRNGNESTIDLVICNQFMIDRVDSMIIDECGKWKPANYDAKKVKVTDHNTILLNLTIERCPPRKPVPYINTKNEEERDAFKEFIENSDIMSLFNGVGGVDVNSGYKELMRIWDEGIDKSFKKIMPKKNKKPNITAEVRSLMQQEKWIRANVIENPQRGRDIANITKAIRLQIDSERSKKMGNKIQKIRESKNPQGEIFKIRREAKSSERVGFPLKDTKGNLQVSKEGVDNVVCEHFKMVFAQNPIPEGELWQKYWKEVDEVFDAIQKLEDVGEVDGPSYEEIEKLLHAIDVKKSVLGSLKGDLLKTVGEPIFQAIYRLLLACFDIEDIPIQMKIEKMVLLYKNAGELFDMDNYRGIFIRSVILSILQKWLYSKCSPIVDSNGSENAFGGRVKRSVKEVLLIVRLMQDQSHWTGQPLILKFLDVRKFFDTMNYKRCLIEAYRSGIRGKYWRLYKATNECKQCIPYTPLGEGRQIDVNEVFVQGSSDAMLMAWNLVDEINKENQDVYDPVISIEGVSIPRLVFVDDLLEMARTFMDTNVGTVSNEIFEKKNRLDFKPSKCKIICMNCSDDDVKLDDVVLEIVIKHKYLGTLVAKKGRIEDLLKRIGECQGVLNETVLICKEGGINFIGLQFVLVLIDSCFKSKFKHGCEVWDEFSTKNRQTINALIPNTIKRVMMLPKSTPSNAIIHDFGIVDLEWDVRIERVLLAAEVMQMPENRIVRRLFVELLEKRVTGFCTQILTDLQCMRIEELDQVIKEANPREFLKKRVVNLQREELVKGMMVASKTDSLLLNFNYDGKMKAYLRDLPYEEARIVLMYRSRMFPTKTNFKNRWSSSSTCSFCCKDDTDEHLFSCGGFADLMQDSVSHQLFFQLNCQIEELRIAARVLIAVYDRLLAIQEDQDVNMNDSE